MAGWLDQILTASSTVIGAGIALGGGWLAQSRQDRRERAAREHERLVAIAARREEFELARLVEMHGLLRAQEDALWPFIEVHQGTAPRQWTAEEASTRLQAMEASSIAVLAQVGFILDDQVRERVSAASENMVRAGGELYDDYDDSRVEPHRQLIKAAYDALTARVREIYAGREAS